MSYFIRRTVIVVLLFMLSASLGRTDFEIVAASTVQEPKISAQSFVLTDEAGKVILSRKPHERLPGASMIKLMTALIAVENCELGDEFTVARAHTLAQGSRMYLREGERVTLLDLLYGLLLSSGNDAADAIADMVFGCQELFVQKMNEKAIRIGMKNTLFANPSGLPGGQQYTTAYDMALLIAKAMDHEVLAVILGTREEVRTERTLVNHNRLLHTCPGIDGGKTGYTMSAGRCLVTTANRKARRLYIVTLNAPNDWNDHELLYDYGFSLYEDIVMLVKGEYPIPLVVVGGAVGAVSLYIEEDIAVRISQAEKQSVEIVVYLPRFEYAPIKSGAIAGRVELWLDGKILAVTKLYCAKGVLYKNVAKHVYRHNECKPIEPAI